MGCTVLLVSHSMEDVARYASKILVMNKSEIFCIRKNLRTYLSKSDEIEKIGLSVPQITRVFNLMRKRELILKMTVYTVKYSQGKNT